MKRFGVAIALVAIAVCMLGAMFSFADNDIVPGKAVVRKVDGTIEVVQIANDSNDFSEVQAKAKEANAQLMMKSREGNVSDYEMSMALTADARNEGLPTLEELQNSDVYELAVPYVTYSIPENERGLGVSNLRKEQNELIPEGSHRGWSYYAIGADAIEDYFEDHDPSNVIVAVLDTGVYTEHSSLKDACVPGYNFIDDNTDVSDVEGHGTHVAATIAGDRDDWVPGIAEGVKIMPVKVLNDNSFGSNAEIAEGIKWAVANGADVINMSLGSSEPDDLTKQEIQKAVDAGVIVIAASGNESNHYVEGEEHNEGFVFDNEKRYTKPLNYPAGYQSVISVGSVGYEHQIQKGDLLEYYYISDFSNIGSAADTDSGLELDVTAPGSHIRAASPKQDTYSQKSGTSMAAPHVSAVAAALKVRNGDDFTAEEARKIFEVTSAKDHFITAPEQAYAAGYDPYLGYGVVNARNALFHDKIISVDVTDNEGRTLLQEENAFREAEAFEPDITSYTLDIPSGIEFVSFELESPQGARFVSRSDEKTEHDRITGNDVTFTYQTTPAYGTPTTYTFKLVRIDDVTDPYLMSMRVNDGGVLEWKGTYDHHPVLASPISEGALVIDLVPSSEKTEMSVDLGPATGPAITIDMNDGNGYFMLKMKAESGASESYYVDVEYFGEKASDTTIESIQSKAMVNEVVTDTDVEWTCNDSLNTFETTVTREVDELSFEPLLGNQKSQVEVWRSDDLNWRRKQGNALTLNFYENDFEVKVTAQDGSVEYYTLHVYREGVNNTNYKYLKMSEPYEADFTAIYEDGNEFEVVLDKVYSEVTVVFEQESEFTTYIEKIGNKYGEIIEPGTPITIPLTNGEGQYSYYVDTDGYLHTHTLIIRQKNAVSTLDNLWTDPGKLSPAFNPNNKRYEVRVPEDEPTVLIAGGPSFRSSTITIDGIAEDVKGLFHILPLSKGENKFDIVVTAETGDSTTYMVNIIRGEVKDDDKDSGSTKKPSTGGGSNSGGGGYVPPSNPMTAPAPAEPVDTGKDKVQIIESDNKSQATIEVSKTRVENLIKAAKGQPIKLELEEAVEADKLELKVGKDIVSKLKEEKAKVAIDTGNAVFELDGEGMEKLLKDGEELAFATEEVKTSMATEQTGNSLTTVAKVMDLDILVDGEKVDKLDDPVQVTLAYDTEKVGNKYKLSVYWFNEEDGRWEVIRSKRIADGSMQFTAKHFSKYTVMESAKTFVDIEDHWGRSFIELAAAKGITHGVSETHFAPNNALRRSEFVTLLSNLLDLNTDAPESSYTDVPTAAWFSKSINAAVQAGIVPNDGGNFRPNDPITREEMATMLVEAYLHINDMKRGELFMTQQVMFQDEGASAPEHRTDVRLMKALGIMVGDGVNFRPQDGATRAESMTVLIRLLQEMDGI